mgnify:FL=1
MRYIELEEVIYIYTEIIQRTGGEPGLNDERLLESILEKPLVTFEGEELYPDLFTKAAVLMYAIITNKPFVEGNKRTAFMCAMFLLRFNGYQIIASQESLLELVTGAGAGKYQVDQIVRWFKKNAVPV